MATSQHIFGPVPSRRLGSSLGINNIPPKRCTYACVYCQLGNEIGMIDHREEFFEPEQLARETENKLLQLDQAAEMPDYLTIVPDGEPTLDKNLGRLIDLLKPLGIKIAVISNGSTLHLPEVREDLSRADLVSVKVDAAQEKIWQGVNRPHGRLQLKKLFNGIRQFSQEYTGILVSETMLVANLNDGASSLPETAHFLSSLELERCYLAIPTRPPAEKWVSPPTEETLTRAYQIFQERGLQTELLIGYEGDQFSSTGDVEADLLSITAVHPMREDAVLQLVERSGKESAVLQKLVQEEKLVASTYQGYRYYLRKFYLS